MTELPPCYAPGIRAVDLTTTWEPQLQRFFEENPEYFIFVGGEPPASDEAHKAIHEGPPPGWAFKRKWLIGYLDASDSLVAMVDVIEDLLAPGVWHIGLFILATRRHGSGEAQALIRGVEAWAKDNGAKWLRLGAVKGNVRAERFWERLGFQDACVRDNVEMKSRVNRIRVMFKPLAGGKKEEYLALVPRDRPG